MKEITPKDSPKVSGGISLDDVLPMPTFPDYPQFPGGLPLPDPVDPSIETYPK